MIRGRIVDLSHKLVPGKEEYGLEAMAHFTCVGATVEELRQTLQEMQDAGIHNVLALRGDQPAGEEEWIKTDGGLELPAKVVQGRLGHSSITMTLDRYGHLFKPDEKSIRRELEKATRFFTAT